MIETILFFTLGFLCAGFIALMVAPAIWRRAVALTRRRIEASVPLTLNEIQADKDRMRAEFAMSTRRLEMSVKEFRDKAAGQTIEISRSREELRKAVEERDRFNNSIAELEAQASDLRTQLRQAEEKLQQATTRLASAERQLEERSRELEKLGDMFEEASLSSSTRQIELVQRESEVERMTSDFRTLKGKSEEDARRIKEMADEIRLAQQNLKEERKRAAELERRLKGGLATPDRDTRIDQSEAGAEVMARLKDDRGPLEKRLTVFTRENKKLRDELKQLKAARAEESTEDRRGTALLREQINDIAAEIVHLTARLEGPDSPVYDILRESPPADGSPEAGSAVASLADRVRALQKAASAGG